MDNDQLQELINFAKDNGLMNEEFVYVINRYNEFINDIDEIEDIDD